MSADHTNTIMKNEAELYDSFNKLQVLLSKYLDVYPLIEFSKENSHDVNNYLEGMSCLQDSFNALLGALKLHSQILGVELKSE
jgi:hypothetical protein